MIIDERMVSFINSFDSGDSEIVEEIERQAIAGRVPIIRQEMGSLLKVLIALKKPSRILEVGTAVGYSSILMAENMPENCTITTIEKYEKRIPIARENFKKAGYEDRITLLEGDALEVMQGL
ncbi:MAG: methyltransferase domain-containing protein, partial [Thermoflexaceae bacterium]|nr:methyltransferase domain-containing protein [Thermoflexaceae bacterium]